MTAKGYGFTALTGGGAGALDAIDGSILVAGDFAFGGSAASTLGATFVVVASGAVADGITVITPLVNAGTKRWHLLRNQTKNGTDIYDGTNIAHLQFTANELELYSERHSGVVKVMVEDAAGNKDTAITATGAGAVAAYYDNSKKIETTTAGVTVTGGVIETVPTFARKNFIINGNMDIWQRGTNFTFTSSQTGYTADRWSVHNVTDGTLTSFANTGTPTIAQMGYKGVYGNLLTFTVADAALAAGQYSMLSYKLEGFDAAKLMGQVVTLSFWVYSKITGTFCVAFKSSTGDRSYVAEYTIAQADTFEKKTITLTMHDGSAGTWDYGNGVGLEVIFCFGSGTTYKTANVNTWEAGNYLATTNQTNLAATIDNYITINTVQLELGAYATPFEFRPFEEELALCQRYYEKSYQLASAPGAAEAPGGVVYQASGILGYVPVYFKVKKRATPGTLAIYSTATGTVAKSRNLTDAADVNAAFTTYAGENGSVADFTTIDQKAYAFHWTADAEL